MFGMPFGLFRCFIFLAVLTDTLYLCHIKATTMSKTQKEFDDAIARCRDIFKKKLFDYGASWRILRPQSVTDQLFIKAKRIRTLETSGTSAVGEGILPEFIAIVNYAVIGCIQLALGASDTKDISPEEALALYDAKIAEARSLMIAKNTDYGEAWREMRVASYTDFILTKIERVKEIEENNGMTLISEGIDANYFDMLNYAVFGIIKLTPVCEE